MSNNPARRCARCLCRELSEQAPFGKFRLVGDAEGGPPVCPPKKGCLDRKRQLTFPEFFAS